MFSRIRGVETDKKNTVFDEDYEYYAHFALVNTDGGKVKAICSWGGFYDYYASQSSQEQEAFLRDLESKKYPRLLYLLTQSEYRFEKVNGIGGFSIETDIDYTNDIDAMAKAVAKAFKIQHSTFLYQQPLRYGREPAFWFGVNYCSVMYCFIRCQ